jgi:translation initiation factor 3 subunit A
MSNYYMKLAEIFYRCDTMLFHAATLVKHFLLAREMKKNMSQEELHSLASRVYCAILAIPLTGQREHNLDYALDGNESLPPYKQKILSNVIGLSSPPTREQLVKDLVRLNINHLAHPELTKLYQHMEVDFHPLQLNKRVRPALEFIADQPTLKPYLGSLQNILVVRTLLQCSQVYQCLRLDKFIQLCATSQILEKRGHEAAAAQNAESAPKIDPADDRQLSLTIESIIVSNIYQLELPVRLDLREGTLRFNVYNDFGIGTHQLDSSDLLLGPTTESRQTSWPISESVCGQLASLCCALHQVVEKLEPMERNTSRIEAIEYAVQAYKQGGDNHHKRLLDRKILIEERKVAQEAYFDQMTRQEQQKRELAEQRLKEAEKQRREKEQKEREHRKLEEETRKLEEQIHREKLQQFLGKGLQGVSEAQIASMNSDELRNLEIEEQKRRFTEKAERARLLERKQDFLIRALNCEEQPILHKEAEANPILARERYEEAHRLKVEKAKLEHTAQLADKDRLGRMAANVESFLATIRKEARNAYQKSLLAWESECEEERQRILKMQREKRKEERKAAYIKRKLEERERQEKLEQQKREEDERMRLEEQRKPKQAVMSNPQPATGGGRAPAFISGVRTEGGWRQRQLEKESEWKNGRSETKPVTDNCRPDTTRNAPPPTNEAKPVTDNWRPDTTRNAPPPTNEERFGTPATGQVRRNVPASPLEVTTWRRPGDTTQQEQPQSTDRSASGFGSVTGIRGNPPSTPIKKSEYIPPHLRQQQQQATPKQPKESAPQTDNDGWSTVGGKRTLR